MPRMFSSTTYTAPAKAAQSASTLAALEERQKLATLAAAKAAQGREIANPWQGAAQLVDVFGQNLAANRAGREYEAGQQELGQVMQNFNPETGFTGGDLDVISRRMGPETGMSLMLDAVKATREREQRALELAGKQKEVRQPTPEEVKLFGLPEGKPYMMTRTGNSDWTPEAIGGGGVSITNMPENKAAGAWGVDRANKLSATLDAAANDGISAKSDDIALKELETMLPNLQTGTPAMVTDYLKSNWGISLEGADGVQGVQAIISRLTPAQRPPGSGTMSDRDIELFKASLPSILNSPGGNQIIMNYLRGMNQYRQALGQIAIEAGNMDDPMAARQFYYDRASKLQNPLADLRAATKGAPAPAVAAPGAAPPAAPGAPAKPPISLSTVPRKPDGGMDFSGYSLEELEELKRQMP